MQRHDYIDIAKGIGILLVVWAHILLSGASHKVIYAFHMPLFFLISGMLFRREKYPGILCFIKKRAKRLLIPFAIYSVVTWLIWAAFRFIRHDAVVSFWDPLLQTIIAKGSGAYMVHNSALWFIPCLFATEIIFFTFSKCNTFVRFTISLICASLSFILGYIFGNDWWFLLPWNIDAALIGLIFYCVGNIANQKKLGNHIVEYTRKKLGPSIVLFFMIAIILYWSAMAYGECSMGSSSYQCNGLIFIMRALIGCAACLLLSILLSHIRNNFFIRKYLIHEGMSSLDIMSIHIPIKGIVIMLIAVGLQVDSDIISSSFSYSLLAFTFTMLIVDALVCIIHYVETRFHHSSHM